MTEFDTYQNMATTTFVFPQYAFNLMRQDVYSNRNMNTLFQSSFISFRSLQTKLSPIYGHLVVNHATHLWKKSIGASLRMYTMNEQSNLFMCTMFQRKKNNINKLSLIEATNSSNNQSNNDSISMHKKNIENHDIKFSIIATITLIMSTINKILYKMALVPLKNYPFFWPKFLHLVMLLYILQFYFSAIRLE